MSITGEVFQRCGPLELGKGEEGAQLALSQEKLRVAS